MRSVVSGAPPRLTGGSDNFFPAGTVVPVDGAVGEWSGVLSELAFAERELVDGLAGLDDAAARATSGLPGWSRGHVLTHLARNADGMVNLVRWAQTGEATPMYASAEARAADIEAGSGRPAAELSRDVAESGSRLLHALAGLTVADLPAVVELGAARRKLPAADLPRMRMREVLIHRVDLHLGFVPADWPAAFATRTLDELVPSFRAGGAMPVATLSATDVGLSWDVAPPGGTGGAGGTLIGPAQALLAWLVGRIPSGEAVDHGVELDGGGAVPSAPPWV